MVCRGENETWFQQKSKCHLNLDDRSEELEEFRIIEDTGEVKLKWKEEETYEKHFIDNFQRDNSGLFIVSLPLRAGSMS